MNAIEDWQGVIFRNLVVPFYKAELRSTTRNVVSSKVASAHVTRLHNACMRHCVAFGKQKGD